MSQRATRLLCLAPLAHPIGGKIPVPLDGAVQHSAKDSWHVGTSRQTLFLTRQSSALSGRLQAMPGIRRVKKR